MMWKKALTAVAAVGALCLIVLSPSSAVSQSVDYIDASQCFDSGWVGDAGNASALDIDGDGKKDLLISLFDIGDTTPENVGMAWRRTGASTHTPWYENRSQYLFADGVKPPENVFGFLTADYDNDGDLDTYCPNPTDAILYENRSGVLTNVTSHSDDLDTYDETMGASWADIDGDSYLDLIILQPDAAIVTDWMAFRSDTQRILMNVPNPDYDGVSDEPQRIFEEPQIPLILSADGIGSVVTADFDGDHDIDIILMHAGTATAPVSRYFENKMNVDGSFANVTSANLGNVESLWNYSKTAGMVVDVDNDGTLDIVYSCANRYGYVSNDGAGVMSAGFDDSENQAPTDIGIADFDLDGRFDLFRGHDQTSASNPHVYANQIVSGNVEFSDVTNSIGLNVDGDTQGLCLADMNRDLALDGLTEVYYCRTDDNFQYVAQFSGGSYNWVGIDLRSYGGLDNYYCIGATVQVDDGTTTRTRVIDGGSSRGSQQDLSLVFGLGSYTGTVDVAVTLPSGRTRQFVGRAVNQYHTLNADLVVEDVDLTRVFDIQGDSETWKVEWITNFQTDATRDAVTFTVLLGDPLETVNGVPLGDPVTYTGSTTIESQSDGTYKHTFDLDDIECAVGRKVQCEVESWLGNENGSGSDSYKARFCISQ